MPNPYFRFKQFTVYHDLCAMKVGIDGVLLGAWAPVPFDASAVLDIGTGCGVIALMIAQRSHAVIDAIDIDQGAYDQARINRDASPWANRLNIHLASLSEYSDNCKRQYDLIVSNPPYFNGSMKAPERARNVARHTDTLNHESLIIISSQLIKKTGSICLILPVTEGMQCVKIAKKNGLSCYQQVVVYPAPDRPSKRLLLQFGWEHRHTIQSELVIESHIRHQYSEDFTALAKDYYLKL